MSAAPDLNRTPDLVVLGATTVGYYLARDLLKTPWKRRLAGLSVLAAGGAAAWSKFRSQTPATEQAARQATLSTTPDSTGHGGTPTPGASPRSYLVPAAVGGVTLIAGSWFNAKIDRLATGAITRTVGKLPLVGGLFRRLPNTTWGIAQVGLVAAVARLSEENPAVAADAAATTGAKTPVTSSAKDAK